MTAGNASPYSDGAAARAADDADRAKELGLKPLARFITFAAAGVDPDVMGIGPIKAVPKALKRAGMTMNDIDLIEFNEAFAAQVVAVVRDLGFDEEKVNVNGGAIALGHPLGATGAKLTTQLVHELGKRGGGIGSRDDVHRRRNGRGRAVRGVRRVARRRAATALHPRRARRIVSPVALPGSPMRSLLSARRRRGVISGPSSDHDQRSPRRSSFTPIEFSTAAGTSFRADRSS